MTELLEFELYLVRAQSSNTRVIVQFSELNDF